MNCTLRRIAGITLVTFFAATGSSLAGEAPVNKKPDPEQMKQMQQIMMQQMQMMKPEMRKRVKVLSPENKQALIRILAQHSRRSDSVTFRQVMHEVQADYQSMATGIFTDNPEQAAASARRLANHRIPRGGLLPYLKIEDVTDEKVGALVPFNDSVEGNALRLAEAAEQGDMTSAAKYMGEIAGGCVACHNVFRGKPGQSQWLMQ